MQLKDSQLRFLTHFRKTRSAFTFDMDDVLSNALGVLAGIGDVRNYAEAESIIESYKSRLDFGWALSSALCDPTTSIPVRQLAGILLKSWITDQSVPKESILQLQQFVPLILSSSDQKITTIAGMVVAALVNADSSCFLGLLSHLLALVGSPTTPSASISGVLECLDVLSDEYLDPELVAVIPTVYTSLVNRLGVVGDSLDLKLRILKAIRSTFFNLMTEVPTLGAFFLDFFPPFVDACLKIFKDLALSADMMFALSEFTSIMCLAARCIPKAIYALMPQSFAYLTPVYLQIISHYQQLSLDVGGSDDLISIEAFLESVLELFTAITQSSNSALQGTFVNDIPTFTNVLESGCYLLEPSHNDLLLWSSDASEFAASCAFADELVEGNWTVRSSALQFLDTMLQRYGDDAAKVLLGSLHSLLAHSHSLQLNGDERYWHVHDSALSVAVILMESGYISGDTQVQLIATHVIPHIKAPWSELSVFKSRCLWVLADYPVQNCGALICDALVNSGLDDILLVASCRSLGLQCQAFPEIISQVNLETVLHSMAVAITRLLGSSVLLLLTEPMCQLVSQCSKLPPGMDKFVASAWLDATRTSDYFAMISLQDLCTELLLKDASVLEAFVPHICDVLQNGSDTSKECALSLIEQFPIYPVQMHPCINETLKLFTQSLNHSIMISALICLEKALLVMKEDGLAIVPVVFDGLIRVLDENEAAFSDVALIKCPSTIYNLVCGFPSVSLSALVPAIMNRLANAQHDSLIEEICLMFAKLLLKFEGEFFSFLCSLPHLVKNGSSTTAVRLLATTWASFLYNDEVPRRTKTMILGFCKFIALSSGNAEVESSTVSIDSVGAFNFKEYSIKLLQRINAWLENASTRTGNFGNFGTGDFDDFDALDMSELLCGDFDEEPEEDAYPSINLNEFLGAFVVDLNKRYIQ